MLGTAMLGTTMLGDTGIVEAGDLTPPVISVQVVGR